MDRNKHKVATTDTGHFELVEINTEWHSRHKLSEHPTLDQRVSYHMEHARRCPCSLHDEDILDELKRRYSEKHQDFWIEHNINDHRALGLWAADCAERLLPYFEEKYGEDAHPRDAIKTLRKWVETGKFKMSVIRAAALPAHASAKKVDKKDKAAIFAAHAAGQALGTAHGPTHSLGVVQYSIKLMVEANPTNPKVAVAREREWQTNHLPENLRGWVDSWIKRTEKMLPKDVKNKLL